MGNNIYSSKFICCNKVSIAKGTEMNKIINILKEYDQLHVLNFFDTLSQYEKDKMVSQINNIDFECIRKEINDRITKGNIQPIDVLTLEQIAKIKVECKDIGLEVIRKHKLGLILLAGGMGTRLGSEEPKGLFNIGIHKNLYIFECLINNIMKIVNLTETWIDLFVMTSDLNYDSTIAFFRNKNYFGYSANNIYFYKQTSTPVTDFQGKILMKSKSEILTSPNGNGSWYISLLKSEHAEMVKQNKYDWFNVFAVDNVLQGIADPNFLGSIIAGGFNSGAKVIKKNNPSEKVGVMCLEDGKPSVVEYYELTPELLNAKDKEGNYIYNYGTILNYIFSAKILDTIVNNNLPYHRVKKKVKYMDNNGEIIIPIEENCYKYETLVLDMVKYMNNCLLFEVDRNKEFAPIKNLVGTDSVETARKLLIENNVEL